MRRLIFHPKPAWRDYAWWRHRVVGQTGKWTDGRVAEAAASRANTMYLHTMLYLYAIYKVHFLI